MRRLLAAALALVLAHGAQAAAGAGSDERAVVRLYTRDADLVARLGAVHGHLIVDRHKGFVVFEATALEQAALARSTHDWEIDADATRALNLPRERLPGQAKGIPGFACYRTVAETNARLDELVAQHPGFASLVDIGDSWEKATAQPGGGEDLRVLRLTNAAVPGDKPKVFIMTSVHAREYTPAELGLRYAEWLLAQRSSDPEAAWILDHQETHLLVQANPDGRKKAETALSWRKNTNTAYCGAASNSRGADLNRNWPFKWAGVPNNGGSSPLPCDGTYRGPSAASEPETQATVAYVRSIFPDRRGPLDTDPADPDTAGMFFDIHSYSQLVLWPWGWTALGTPAPDGASLEALGRRMAWRNDYTPEQINQLYPTDGTTADTVYGELGVAALSFELGTAFFQDCALFESAILPDNLAALRFAARTARAPYRVASGPDAREVSTTPDLLVAGETGSLRAVLDDTRYSNVQGGTQATQAIAAASAWVGTPPWQSGAVARPLAAVDGAFDAGIEAVGAPLDTGALAPGRHLAWVQGRDASGNDGPWAAGFVQVYAAQDIGTVGGRVRRAGTGAPVAGASIRASGFASTSAADGAYARRLPAGTYVLRAEAEGFEPEDLPAVTLAGGDAATRDVTLYALCRVAGTDAESGAAGWTAQAPWAITTAATTQTGSRAWTESPAGSYANNVSTSLTSPTVDLTGYANPRVVFDSWCDTEAGYDFGNLEYSANGGTSWSTFAWRCSGDPALRRVAVDLPALAGVAQARVRFRFTSDNGVVDDGWYVDNVAIEAGGAACRATQAPVDPVFADGFE
jgi:murein tripeptide amidase MpaA